MSENRENPCVAEAYARLERFPFGSARRALLQWFDKHGRSFPWRDDPQVYRVWISEIMLQQTTTQTVKAYFERFLARFPDPRTLAEAKEEEVLAMWEGLGYYRRARSLHSAARVMTERFNGKLPECYDDILALPGVGRYCAGAILSFGYDRRFPILEANTTRLHARLFALDEETDAPAAQKLLWRVALEWLPEESSRRQRGLYRRLNGALTDLGSMVCQPVAPKCAECPLESFCAARNERLENVLPLRKKKEEPIVRTDVAFWITRGELAKSAVSSRPGSPESPDDVLLMRQPTGALWAGLWDFPRLEVRGWRDPKDDAWRLDPELADRVELFMTTEVGAPARQYWPGDVLTSFKHSVTRYRVTLSLCRLQTERPKLCRQRSLLDALEPSAREKKCQTRSDMTRTLGALWRWVPVAELGDYPLSSPGRRIAKYIGEHAEN